MSVLEPGAAESFIFRLWKHHNNNPAVKWVNTYEARFTALGSSEDLDSLLFGLAAFEATLLYTTATIEYGTISTWEEDGHPYNPDAFRTTTLNLGGERDPGSAYVEDLRVVVYVRRDVSSGRIGKLELRNSVASTEVGTPAGSFALLEPGDMQTLINSGISAGGLDTNFAGGSAQPHLAMIGAEQVTRFITGFSVGGVSIVKLNHKYFDRA
jgi:hypothetical protein